MALVVKNTPTNAGDIRDAGSIPGLGRSPRGGHGNPLQYYCLENPMDRGAWGLLNLALKSDCNLKPVSDQIRSVAQSCPTLCHPMIHSAPGLPVHHQLPEFTETHVHRVRIPSSHFILCCTLLLLPPIPPSIRVFSNESTLCMRWPKYWSFSFSIIPSNWQL